MKQTVFQITQNHAIAPGVMEMRLTGETAGIRPGGFVNIQIAGLYLRRPISVCDLDGNTLTLIYKVVGAGTERLSQMPAGERLDLLTGLGNGYDLSKSGEAPLLIGGGVGIPPLYLLCRKLREAGRTVRVILGFNTASEVFYEERFKALGAETLVTTADGSYGIKGFVTAAIETLPSPSFVYTCGPEPMLKAVYNSTECGGEYSFEERMGCGFGACMGCSCKTKYGNKRICKDGPVLEREEIIW